MDFDLIQGIINALNLDSRITNLIGAMPNMRIANQIVPEGTAFPYCKIGKAGRGRHTYYLGAANEDRDSDVSIVFIGRNDHVNSEGDVVLLDKYAKEATTPCKVVAAKLVTFLRIGDLQDSPATEYAQGNIEYFSCGGIYRAHFQLS